LGWYQFLGFSWQFRPMAILLPALLLSFTASLQAPILEEVIFRGFIFQTALDRWGLRLAVFISSLLFGLAHLANEDSSFGWLPAVVSTFLAGLMFAQAYLVHKSLWIPVGIHFGWIFSGRLLNDVGRTVDETLLFASKVEAPPLIASPSGGGAGLFELIGVGLVSFILWQMSKRHKPNIMV
jgi:membrane protease YdiL (CAAX protease family)